MGNAINPKPPIMGSKGNLLFPATAEPIDMSNSGFPPAVSPGTPGAKPSAGPLINPPPGMADSSFEKFPGMQPLPALILK